ncbi:type II-A CRISPR-associated protein Csn2 [Lentilactobacillus diolivorans]|uniref:type II-A CRISPR-associated protein Csn2 n=1 Tax=Lentilactobacillus diolivorans TaxID=179838 RepID=UPI0024699D28|nr:type II-A CRISPR-associated protein Csn2 [Lentilactobacillus diolivorans]MDH5104790.1 type II-A CRISPR-associated protein Csn2 [Lentilactobacillus diolivorans]
MKISYASHKQIEVANDRPTVIATNNPTVYYDLLTGLSSFNEKVKIFDDAYNELEVKKVIDWHGDAVTSENLTEQYSSLLIKQLEKMLTDDQRKILNNLNDKLYTAVQDSLFMIDLPLEVKKDDDLKRLFKYCKIHFNADAMRDPYAIIESILKVHLECGEESCIGLTNVAHYLNQDKMHDLNALVSTVKIPVIMIEFTEMKFQTLYGNAEFYYIDEDFVDWHS